MNEQWIPIMNYEGIYSISNLGNVRKEFRIEIRSGRKYTHKQKNIKPDINSAGYKRVNLWKNSKSKRFFIHRLVATHFIKNSERKPIVNHKDGNKLNNCYFNLEWSTVSENSLHAINTLGFIPDTTGINEPKRVRQIDIKSGNVIAEFDTITEAFKKTKISHISSVCRGVRKTAGGYKWEYA